MIKIKSMTGFLLLYAVIQGFAQQIPQEQVVKLKDMTLHIIPQAHIDLAWWWRYNPETVDVVITHTLETAFANMEKFPDYTFTFLQVPAIAPLEESYPDLFYKLRYYVHRKTALEGRIKNPGAGGTAGRLAIGSALWCEIDGCLPCGESLVRQCIYGKRFFKEVFGIDVRTAWFQDAWTHPWTYPQILRKSGIDSYMFTRPRGEGEQMFWWESPDGSRVFVYKPLKEGGESLPAQEEIDSYLLNLNQRYGVKNGLTLVGVGNHGGGAISADVERMKKTMVEKTLPPYKKDSPARMIFSMPDRFVASVREQENNFPVIKNELTPTIRGAYTTVGEIKKGNRYAENLLMTWEKFSAIAACLGNFDYPGEKIFSAWKKIMLNQFHDTISGTDISPSIDDALQRYQDVMEIGQKDLSRSLKSICARINTSRDGKPVIVFNPMGWQRTDIVETVISVMESEPAFEIKDNSGHSIPYQIMSEDKKHDRKVIRLLFLAENMPSLGYKCFWLHPVRKRPEFQTVFKVNEENIENEFFKINIDPSNGCLTSIFDKQYQREILDKTTSANQIQIFEDYGDSEGFLKSSEGVSEYNRWDGPSRQTDSDPRINLIENGPVRQLVRIKKKFGFARFNQTIKLYPNMCRIDFDLVIDWEGKNKMIKIAFPLNVKSAMATYEIPYGTIQRISKGEEQVAQQWVDITEKNYGVSLLNDSRYGHDITENTIRLSVLRSPDRPVYATDEKGIHKIRYALFPHPGGWQQAGVMRRGFEFNNPLLAVIDSNHTGDLPVEHSFVDIDAKNLILTVLKKAEDSDDMVLRFYDAEGENRNAGINLSKYLKIDEAYKTDLMEYPVADLTIDTYQFNVEVGAFSIESVKLMHDNDL